jgi:hypothetical protein
MVLCLHGFAAFQCCIYAANSHGRRTNRVWSSPNHFHPRGSSLLTLSCYFTSHQSSFTHQCKVLNHSCSIPASFLTTSERTMMTNAIHSLAIIDYILQVICAFVLETFGGCAADLEVVQPLATFTSPPDLTLTQ